MSADQRESVLVILDVFDCDLPALDGVALLAPGSHLAAVDVGMAVGALVSYVREDRLRMALGTGNVLVHAAQGITCLVVIEFGDGANRFPPYRRVAILTGNVQISVRTARLCGHLRRRKRRTSSEHRQQQRHSGQIVCFQAVPRPGGLNSARLIRL